MKLAALVVFFSSLLFRDAVGQQCPECTYFVLGFDIGGPAVLRGYSTPDRAESIHALMTTVGFLMKSGSDACLLYSSNACSENGECVPGPEGSNYYHCNCKEGNFVETRETDKYSCNDVDECSNLTLNDCHGNAVCSNTDGGYNCTCKDGFSGNGTTCVDIDECTEELHVCSDLDSCENTLGSYTCLCSESGYTWDGANCVDKNECLTEGSCGENEACENLDGSYTCPCMPGFNRTDGENCVDVNECELATDNCEKGAGGSCENTDGTFFCLCKSGFTGDGTHCEDVDECAFVGFCANGVCENELGSFNCTCNEGFVWSGYACEDPDYCAEPNVCGPNELCENIVGSYNCRCLPGFLSLDDGGCGDIDECLIHEDDCDWVHGACHNTEGGYFCRCSDGFTGDGQNCTDVDECLDESTCRNGACINVAGTFLCECHEGYEEIEGVCTALESTSQSPEVTTATSWVEWLQEVARARWDVWLHGASLRRIQDWIRSKSYARAKCGRYSGIGNSRCG